MKSTARLRLFLILLALLLLGSATPTGPAGEPLPWVIVHADGVSHPLETRATRPVELLALAGVTLAPGDLPLFHGQPVPLDQPLPSSGVIVLQIVRGFPVNTGSQMVETTAPTLAAALWEMGLRLRVRDQVTPTPATPLASPLTAEITLSRPLTILAGAAEVHSRSAGRTVGAALAEAGLALLGVDYARPPQDAPIPGDGRVEVVRVQEEILLEQESLPFDTAFQPDPNIEIDTQSVIQVGQFGLQVRRVRVRYENGIEVSRTTEAEWVAAEPRARIVGYGTKIVIRTLAGGIEYWRAVPAFATSYSPCRLGISACGNTTASGLPLAKGMVGVIRSWYNAMVFSQVYVEGYGVGTIADIGAGVPGQHWIDLGYSDDDWEQWASTVTIYFLTPVPPADQILWILP